MIFFSVELGFRFLVPQECDNHERQEYPLNLYLLIGCGRLTIVRSHSSLLHVNFVFFVSPVSSADQRLPELKNNAGSTVP
jgi:hypothetical protein